MASVFRNAIVTLRGLGRAAGLRLISLFGIIGPWKDSSVQST